MREPAENQIIAGKYRIESIIGYGGMGSVWRARHVTLDMPVAIKFMAPQALADAESRQRFDREARALAALRTPHIVQVIDFGLDGETPYIVMELLEGEDLSTRLSLRRRLPLDEVSRILSHVARALRRAHEAGITHRDLKPSNIFLARVDDEEIVKVLDFGVAKLTQAGLLGDDGLTKAGTLLGSPGYMSPEQARGKEVDFRSDLWALSVIVFRAVTGMKPFAGDSIAELVIKLCIDPRPIPTRVAPDLPPAVDRFFEKAFAASPEDRFQSAVEMASAFAAIMGHRPPDLSRSWLEGPPPHVQGPAASGLPPVPRPPPRTPVPASAAVPRAPVPPPPPPPSALGSGFGPSLGPQTPPPSPARSDTVVGFPLPVPQASQQPSTGEAAGDRLSGPPTIALSPSQPVAVDTDKATVVLASPTAGKEPTPTPHSFGGFAPSGAEASVPPAADPTSAPFPDGALRPMSAPEAQEQPDLLLQRPTIPGIPRPQGLPGRLPADTKILVLAAAGAALLAILVSLAIAGLRSDPDEPRPASDDIGSAPSATATLEPTAAPSATDTPSDTPGATTNTPSASASATAPEPASTPTPAPTPKPTYIAPKPKPTTTKPRPTSSGTTTRPKPYPTSTSTKKKPR